MAPTIASTVLDRPAAEVFAYTTDPTRFHEWQHDAIDARLEQPGPPRVGRASASCSSRLSSAVRPIRRCRPTSKP